MSAVALHDHRQPNVLEVLDGVTFFECRDLWVTSSALSRPQCTAWRLLTWLHSKKMRIIQDTKYKMCIESLVHLTMQPCGFSQ